MKLRIVIKLFLLVLFGGLFGLFMQHDHERWHALGKQAYLENQAIWFDKKMAVPSSTGIQVSEWILIACVVGLAYEGACHFGEALLSRKAITQNK